MTSSAWSRVPAVVWVVTFHCSGTIVFGSLLGVPSLGMHLAMSVALEFFEAANADLDCRPQRPFDGDFRVSPLPFDRVLTQIQTATTQTLTKVRSRAQRLLVSIGPRSRRGLPTCETGTPVTSFPAGSESSHTCRLGSMPGSSILGSRALGLIARPMARIRCDGPRRHRYIRKQAT